MVADLLRRRYRLMAVVVLVLLAALVVPKALLANAQSRASAQQQSGAIFTVDFPNGGISYSPQNIRISVGDEVQWQGAGGLGGDFTSHPLVSDEGLWPVQSTGTTFTFKFTQAGLYQYHCQIHGPLGMVGTVLVVGNDRSYLPFIAN